MLDFCDTTTVFMYLQPPSYVYVFIPDNFPPTSNRGGASGATFTNHVAGNRAISYNMVIYPSYTTCVNTRACANGAELAIFEIIFYRERNSDLDIVNFL